MPKLIIDDLPIEVPAGTKVIDAAERLGILIPRFCYHEGLGAVGACRMCAVKFLQGPFKGVQMSCMIEAQDGMVVSTTDEEAVAFRRFIIECLMLNHPHDCPVCDEGGQCLLQDETVSGGHGLRRYLGPKRTYRDQFLGPFIAHEMNRCIHCYRCARFYQEFSGYRDLGVMQIASKVYFGRFEDGALESPFSGNLLDLCPTGVYTDKPSRYKARYWDMERSPSLCVHCSLGCHTTANARYREVLRIEARFSEAVNGHFICDRGRYGFAYANRANRPRTARLSGRSAPFEEALAEADRRLGAVEAAHGKRAVAAVGSGRAGSETLIALKDLCAARDWLAPVLFADPAVQAAAVAGVSSHHRDLAVSLRELEQSDCILVVGVDPVNEAPMLALSLRQAFRRGARILLVDPRPVEMPLDFEHHPVPSADFETGFRELLEKVLSNGESASGIGLAGSHFPVVVCGTAIVPASVVARCVEAADRLRLARGKAGFFSVLPEANQYLAALLSVAVEQTFETLVEGIEAGRIRGLVVAESDLSRSPVDAARLEAALDRLECLLVLDHLPTPTARRADVLLPTTAPFEALSTVVSQEGRVQVAEPVHVGGVPLQQETAGSHPRREYGSDVPGADMRPAAEVLSYLAGRNWTPLDRAALAAAAGAEWDGERLFATAAAAPSAPGVQGPAAPIAPGCLVPLSVDWTFGTEELSSYSPVIEGAEKPPCCTVHAADAAEAGLADGARVRLCYSRGTVELPLRTSTRMARGIVIVPRHRDIPWQRIVNTLGGVRLEPVEPRVAREQT